MKKLFLLFFIATFLSFLGGCKKEKNEDPLVRAEGRVPNGGQLSTDCESPNPYLLPSVSYEVIDISNVQAYQGYDLAVTLTYDYPNFPIPPLHPEAECLIVYCQACIELNFPIGPSNQRKEVFYSNPHPKVLASGKVPNAQWSNLGLSPGNNFQNNSWKGALAKNADELCVFGSGNTILLELPNGFPQGFDALNAVSSAGGYCIIGNIPEPGPPGNPVSRRRNP